MELLRELLGLQHQHGHLTDQQLQDLALRRGVPQYRIEGLVSFYTHFRRTPPARRQVAVCRDVVCRMHGCCTLLADLQRLAETDDGLEIVEVSCLGRCDHAPAVAIDERPAGPAASAENLLTDAARKKWLRWKENLSGKDDWLSPEEAKTGHEARPTGTITCLGLNPAGEMSGVTTTSGLNRNNQEVTI